MDTTQPRQHANPSTSLIKMRLLIIFVSIAAFCVISELDFKQILKPVIDSSKADRKWKNRVENSTLLLVPENRVVNFTLRPVDMCSDATCCTTKITSRHCQQPCTHFQHCTQQCNNSTLSSIPQRCPYKQSWQKDHRRVIFVGDSVTKQFVEAFRRLMKENGEKHATLVRPSPLQCTSSANRTLCFVETARSSGKDRIIRHAAGNINRTDCRRRTVKEFWNVNLGDTLECMSELGLLKPLDIVVVNAGLHHPNPETLQENTQDFISWTNKQKEKQTDLCVVWRQTLPQHFPTETGAWQSALMHNAKDAIANAKAANSSCCAPSNFPANPQKYNLVTDPMLQDAQIPNIQLFGAMQGLWKYHNDCSEETADCTHWALPAVDLATKMLLNQLYGDVCALKKNRG